MAQLVCTFVYRQNSRISYFSGCLPWRSAVIQGRAHIIVKILVVIGNVQYNVCPSFSLQYRFLIVFTSLPFKLIVCLSG